MHHQLTRVLPYRPDQLFELVGDVESYPDFIPWISALRTWNEGVEGPGVTRVDAEAQVKFSVVRERFSTRVRRDEDACEITVNLLSGPFRRLYNRWTFRPHPAGVELEFEIDFEFKTRFLDQILASNFHRAVDKLVNCFERRAKDRYASA